MIFSNLVTPTLMERIPIENFSELSESSQVSVIHHIRNLRELSLWNAKNKPPTEKKKTSSKEKKSKSTSKKTSADKATEILSNLSEDQLTNLLKSQGVIK